MRAQALLALASLALVAQAPAPWKPVDPARIQEVAAWLSPKPEGLGAPGSDRAFWNQPLTQKRLKRALKMAEALLASPLPPWDDDAFLEFSRKGLRPRGEAMLTPRHNRLSPLVLAECLEWKGRFLPRIEETLKGLCAQPTWVIPAHDRKLLSHSGKAHEVDLHAATSASDLALALHLLGDKLDPTTVRQVREALEARIFAPVRKSLATGKGHHWLKVESNWNAVCLAGVTTAALAVLEDPKDRALFAAAAERFIPAYFGSFHQGGYCTEGLGYWNYGFGRFAELREVLARATAGRVELYTLPGVADAARFGTRIQVAPGAFPPFGDCKVLEGPDPYLLRLVAGAFRDPLPERATESTRPFRLVLGLLDLVEARPMNQARPTLDAAVQDDALRTWWPESSVLVARAAQDRTGLSVKGRLALGIKGGGNGPHSHNDVGSYALFVDGAFVTGDLGGPKAYTADTFGPQRYTRFKLNASEGHPVPLVGGATQKEATTWRPKVLTASFTPQKDRVAYDLKEGYVLPALMRLERVAELDRTQDAATLEDTFQAAAALPFETALILRGPWKQVDPRTLELGEGARRVRVTLESSAPVDVVTSTIQDENADPFTRLAVRLLKPASQGWIRTRFTAPSNPIKP